MDSGRTGVFGANVRRRVVAVAKHAGVPARILLVTWRGTLALAITLSPRNAPKMFAQEGVNTAFTVLFR
ncbi:hypothetical protein DPMN_021302 [Dreissena polymorpha]|uniref:Uncharacterized protein n=1 Tax=Dreissena polymorpha TaxID=45954 RepID=A0A9D4NNZ0_DREPO|nr:hypothetical protein DPMN_021302 [Dreissena polymorpha]